MGVLANQYNSMQSAKNHNNNEDIVIITRSLSVTETQLARSNQIAQITLNLISTSVKQSLPPISVNSSTHTITYRPTFRAMNSHK